jgi:hypothetical protein
MATCWRCASPTCCSPYAEANGALSRSPLDNMASIILAARIHAFRAAWKEAGHKRQPRVSVSRNILAVVDERDRAFFGGGLDAGPMVLLGSPHFSERLEREDR